MRETPRPARRSHDPQVLRAIAHPVRNRILDELGATGPMRAADIARELGIPANQASFHLRQLAKYGLVEEAPEEARDGRDRVWQAAHEAGFNINTSELALAPGGKAAVRSSGGVGQRRPRRGQPRGRLRERPRDAHDGQ